jgi:hypothetical protein
VSRARTLPGRTADRLQPRIGRRLATGADVVASPIEQAYAILRLMQSLEARAAHFDHLATHGRPSERRIAARVRDNCRAWFDELLPTTRWLPTFPTFPSVA